MSTADRPITARRQVRLAVVGRLRSLGGVTVITSNAWPTDPKNLPAIIVNAPAESKQSVNRGVGEFKTSVSIELQGQVTGVDNDAAQDAIEDLLYRVESVVFAGYWLNRVIEQIVSIDTRVEVSAEGGTIKAGFLMTLVAETFESFDPAAVPADPGAWPPAEPVIVPMTSIGLHADMAGTFDPSGTYATPAFPDAVLPAPRTSGPDGRDEGSLDITLPQ